MNAPLRHTLLLVDDHPMMRRGIRQMLELEDDLHIVGEASHGEEALALIEPLKPDLVLLDNNMPQMNGIETLRRLRAMHYTGKVLLFTVSDAEDDIRDALRLDANGYLLKDMEPELLIQYIRDALNGALVISPGHKLGITEGTVKVHVKNLLHKLGLRSRVEAAVWAMEHLRGAG
jgi:two-component system nitrate/nitrite response regulator NarL